MSRRLLILALPLVLLLLGGSAGAASRGPVRVGSVPAHPAGSRVIGALPAATPLRAVIGLRPRDPAALTAYATEVSTPGSSLYHQYLSVAQFAGRFGADPATIASVRAALAREGLRLGATAPNGLSVAVSARAGTLARAFGTAFTRVRLRGGRIAFANTQAPRFAASIAGAIEGVVGLDDLVLPHPLALVHREVARAAAAHATAAHVTSRPRAVHASPDASAPAPCATASAEAAPNDAYTTDQFASAYDFDGLYSSGDVGSGVTVALFELEGNFPSDITAFESCYGITASVSYDKVDGGPPPPSGGPPNYDGLESELDIENVIGLAPAVSAVVYQAPNTNTGYYDNYSTIITQDTAKVISTSWGDCEPVTGATTAQMENTLFQEATTQGQTIVAAAGDDGSEDCAEDIPPSVKLAVDDPASQPFVTGAGGTSLTSPDPRTETVWNDGATGGAGGGGNSAFWTMPAYQSSAPASLNVINANSSAATNCGGTSGYCREVPDVTASADEDHGYLVYYDGNGQPTDASGWTGVGGTSGAAPLWGALFALTDAEPACTQPLGLANPDLYGAAAASYASVFNDITSGDNDMFQAARLDPNHGLFPAGPGYDQASGLGSPNAAALAPALCAQELVVTNPGAQSTTEGVPVSLQLTSSEASGVTYAASGLPAGLSLDAASGLISGTPTTPGVSTVSVTASDASGRSASTSFTWTVIADQVTLAPIAAQTGRVKHPTSLQLHGTDAAGRSITYGASGLPNGLKLTASTGRIAGTPTKAGVFHVTATAEVSGVAPATQHFTWTIAGPPKIAKARIARNGSSLSLKVVAGSHAAAIHKLSVKLPAAVSAVVSGKAKVHGARSVKRSGRTLTIVLRHAARTVSITLRLRASATVTRDAKARRLSVTATVTDAASVRTALKARLRRA